METFYKPLEKLQVLFGSNIVVRDYSGKQKTGKTKELLGENQKVKVNKNNVTKLRNEIIREFTGHSGINKLRNAINSIDLSYNSTYEYGNDSFREEVCNKICKNKKIPEEVLWLLVAFSQLDQFEKDLYNNILAKHGSSLKIFKEEDIKTTKEFYNKYIDSTSILYSPNKNDFILRLGGVSIEDTVVYKNIITTNSLLLVNYMESLVKGLPEDKLSYEKYFYTSIEELRLKYSSKKLVSILKDLPLPIAVGGNIILEKYKFESLFKSILLECEIPEEVRYLFTLQVIYSLLKDNSEDNFEVFKGILEPKEVILEKQFLATSSLNQSDLNELIIFDNNSKYYLITNELALNSISNILSKLNDKVLLEESIKTPTKLLTTTGIIIDLKEELFKGREVLNKEHNNILKLV